MTDTIELEDAILEDELRNNRRVVKHSKLGQLLLRRATPAAERDIAEARRRSYHADLRNEEVLSRKQIENILEARGVWTKEQSDRIEELGNRTTELMAQITSLGFSDPDALIRELVEVNTDLSKAFGLEDVPEDEYDDEQKEIAENLERFFNLDNMARAEEARFLRSKASNSDVADLLNQADAAVYLSGMISDFSEAKQELNELLMEYSKHFGESAEARADRAERLAKIYYCVRTEDGDPVWEDLETLWEEDPEVVMWVSNQLYYYENGVSPEASDVLERFGFMARVTDTENNSDDSPDHTQSNSDGESQEKQPQDSSEAPTATS